MHKAFRILGNRAVALSIRGRQCCQNQTNLFVSSPHGDFRQARYRILFDVCHQKLLYWQGACAKRGNSVLDTFCVQLLLLSQISAPIYQQPFAQQSFASSSDTNSEIDQALAKATESHDAHKLLQVRLVCEQAQQLVRVHLRFVLTKLLVTGCREVW